MELRSGRRLRRSSPPPPHGPSSWRLDLISALPDEMLLLVLARLRCVRAAVVTSLLSRRWRGLWMGLWIGPTDLTFRGLAPTTIKALFRRFAASPQLSTLDIDLPPIKATTRANSLLRAAVRLSPGHLVFTLQESYKRYMADIKLPCFQCTISIELDTPHLVRPPRAGEFTALQSLSVTGKIIDLGPLLVRCPRLRVLSVTYPKKHVLHITLPPGREFPTLEKLSLSGKIVHPGSLLNSCERLRVLNVTQLDTCLLRIMLPPSREFPMLEKLTLSGNIAGLDILLNGCPRVVVLSVTFRRMRLPSLKAALTTLEQATALGLVLSTVGIEIPWRDDITAARFAYLLRTVTRLSPQELVVTDNFEGCDFGMDEIKANLPGFAHATSIEMSLRNVCFKSLPAGQFSMIQRLSLSRLCSMVDIGNLVTRCPRLQVLTVAVSTGKITIHSASLQKLDVNWIVGTECHGIDIVTPVLKQLHLKFRAGRDIGVSISAPMVENVSWQCSYTGSALVFGSWCLQSLTVQTIDDSYVIKREGECSFKQQLPPFHVLCLHLNADNLLDGERNFAHELEKLSVTSFSVMEINFEPAWHVYGSSVLLLLRIRRIRVATKKLKVVLPSWSGVKKACLQNCHCDKPKNWRSQSIFRTRLEEVEVHGFNGEDHEHDFLRLILKCSPGLKSMSVKRSLGFADRTKGLSNISLAHPSVKFYS